MPRSSLKMQSLKQLCASNPEHKRPHRPSFRSCNCLKTARPARGLKKRAAIELSTRSRSGQPGPPLLLWQNIVTVESLMGITAQEHFNAFGCISRFLSKWRVEHIVFRFSPFLSVRLFLPWGLRSLTYLCVNQVVKTLYSVFCHFSELLFCHGASVWQHYLH